MYPPSSIVPGRNGPGWVRVTRSTIASTSSWVRARDVTRAPVSGSVAGNGGSAGELARRTIW